jgi:hypothetical protein
VFLNIDEDLKLQDSTKKVIGSVNLRLSEDDGMYHGNDRHYLSCGASALNMMLAATQAAEVPEPRSILDFGAGAGRVMRWLRAAHPLAQISSCDLRENDMLFCERQFGAKTWPSGTDISALQSPSTYDLLWLGSVITHLSAQNTLDLIDKLISWTAVGGIIVLSFHGKRALHRQDSREFLYIGDAAWESIKTAYFESGYGYADYENQSGYGISLTSLGWIASTIQARMDSRMVLLAEAAWDGHHDVVAIQKLA